MNPLVITSAISGAKSILSKKYVLIPILVFVAYFIFKGGIKKVIRKVRESNFDKNETEDVNQIAQQYRSASNPSGFEWMINWDGSDEDQLEILAHQTRKNFKPIADAYQQKFNETLTDRVRQELNATEFQNWYNIVN